MSLINKIGPNRCRSIVCSKDEGWEMCRFLWCMLEKHLYMWRFYRQWTIAFCTCTSFKRFFFKFGVSANKCHVCLPNQRDLARDVRLWPFHWFASCLQNNMMNKFYLFGCYECSSFQFLDQNLWYHKQRIAPQSQPINHIRNSILFILRVYIR